MTTEQEQKLAWAKEQFEAGTFDGLSTHDIGRKLREVGCDSTTRTAFAKWFVELGLMQGWLDVELGFN